MFTLINSNAGRVGVRVGVTVGVRLGVKVTVGVKVRVAVGVMVGVWETVGVANCAPFDITDGLPAVGVAISRVSEGKNFCQATYKPKIMEQPQKKSKNKDAR